MVQNSEQTRHTMEVAGVVSFYMGAALVVSRAVSFGKRISLTTYLLDGLCVRLPCSSNALTRIHRLPQQQGRPQFVAGLAHAVPVHSTAACSDSSACFRPRYLQGGNSKVGAENCEEADTRNVGERYWTGVQHFVLERC